jgi:hypothetical protein
MKFYPVDIEMLMSGWNVLYDKSETLDISEEKHVIM